MIPKIIHYVWLGRGEKSEKIKCSALIIIKAANVCDKTKIYSMDESYAIHEEKEVESYDIEKGNWFGESAFQNSLNITIRIEGKINVLGGNTF